MNHCCYRFGGLWKVKVKYKVLCLNASLNYRRRGEHISTQFWITTIQLVFICSGVISPWMVCYQSNLGSVQGMRFCGLERGSSWEEIWHEIYAGKPNQKYSKDDKERCWHTNWLVGRQCPDGLGMWRGCSGWERLEDKVEGCFYLVVASITYPTFL